MQTSLTYLEQDASGKAAVRIKVPATDARTPTHFMALLDVSESMMGQNKLGNVKRCMSLLLNFLVPEDKLSIVTFGEESKVVVKHVKAEPASIPMLEQAIESLNVHGCTNLSAGLASIREILGECVDEQLKVSVLVLTDGHANRGAFIPTDLKTIVKRIHELFPVMTMNFIAYGTDHNAELLKELADEVNGSYSIVENLEDAALTMGDALGGAISCVAQNVSIQVPEGTTVEGPFKLVDKRITIGDLYAGSEKLVLIEKHAGPIFVSGVTLPDLAQFNTGVTDVTTNTERNAEIDLTRLRYKCGHLFHALRTQHSSTVDLSSFRAALDDPFLAGNPVTAMLRGELASLEAALEHLRNGMTSQLLARLTQHEAYNYTGAGTSAGISSPGAPVARSSSPGSCPGAPRPDEEDDYGSAQTPMAGEVQRRTATQMRRTVRINPEPPTVHRSESPPPSVGAAEPAPPAVPRTSWLPGWLGGGPA